VFPISGATPYRFPTHLNELVMDRAEGAATEVFMVVLAPGESPPLHVHADTEQIFHVLAGQGELSVSPDPGADPRREPIAAGLVVRIPPGTWHCVLNTGSDELRYLSIDAFPGGVPAAEPTWDSHVRSACAAQGWNFDDIKGRR
jgi:mannose-6-phosphate isomerase-like protein (cupin superfamily)